MIGSTIDIKSYSHSQSDLDVIRSKMMKIIVCTKLPFSFAENKWFTEFCLYLNPEYLPSPRNTSQGVVIKGYDSFPSRDLNIFNPHKGFFSFTADIWISIILVMLVCMHILSMKIKFCKRNLSLLKS